MQEFSATAEPRGRGQEQRPRRAPGQDEGRVEEREQGQADHQGQDQGQLPHQTQGSAGSRLVARITQEN